jgi:hypothetical protein
MKYEKFDEATGESYTWSQNESLLDLQKPERVEEIKAEQKRKETTSKKRINLSLSDVFGSQENDGGDEGCLICHL